MTNKIISGALFLTDGQYVLVEVPTGRTFNFGNCDLPKGCIQDDESLLDGVIREVKEETSLDISQYKNKIKEFGIYNYNSKKDLYFTLLKVDKLPPLSSYFCTSTFIDEKTGIEKPEVQDYKYIKIEDVRLYVFKSLKNVLDNIWADIINTL